MSLYHRGSGASHQNRGRLETQVWGALQAFVFLLLICSCQRGDADILSRAEFEASNQRTQLADHLFSRVILKHTERDSTRLRAMLGLIRLNLDQQHDYRKAVKLAEQVLLEFPSEHERSAESRSVFFEAARVARQQLGEPERALSMLAFAKDNQSLSEKESLELAKTLLANRSFDSALQAFQGAFDLSIKNQNCELSKETQVESMHALALAKRCPQAIEWGEKKLFSGCEPNIYSIRIEMAYCFEREGAPEKAQGLYESVLKDDPSNARVLFLQSQLKMRQKEKGMK